jgi:AcrR family transcriptional regulator
MASTPSRSRSGSPVAAAPETTAADPPLHLDGRRARRIRGRLAVLDAVLDLIDDGQAPPSVEAVSERSGVSQASIFRYFQSIDDLQSEAVTHFAQRHQQLFMWTAPAPEASYDDRLAGLLDQRLDLYETVANVARFARLRAPVNPYVANRLRQIRSDQRAQIEEVLAPELATEHEIVAQRLIDAIFSLLAFEAWDQLDLESNRSRTEIFETWSMAITALLASASAST